MKNILKLYSSLFTTVVLTVMFGLVLSQIIYIIDEYQNPDLRVLITLIVLGIVLLAFMYESFLFTRKLIIRKPAGTNKIAKVSIFENVKQRLKTSDHPLTDNRSVGYVVTFNDGPDEFADREEFYTWLRAVFELQQTMYVSNTKRRSPLSRDYWVRSAGMNKGTYKAYLDILERTHSLDPTAGYHNKRLRTTPWNIVLAADAIYPSVKR